jgi:hypothetical protein
MKLQLALGLGLGAHRKGGAAFNPLSLDGSVLLIDCKATAQIAEIREVEGVPASWKKLVNLANALNPATYANAASEALYSSDGAFVWHKNHLNSMAATTIFRTVIIALQNNNPEYGYIAAPIAMRGGDYVVHMRSTYSHQGYPAGSGLGQGSASAIKMACDTPIGNNVKTILTMRNMSAPTGVIRYNKIPQTLRVDKTGSDENLIIDRLSGNLTPTASRWQGKIYAIYMNSNVMSDADIGLVEDWMKARYSI